MKLSYPFYSKLVCKIGNRYRKVISKVVAVALLSSPFLIPQNLPQYNLNDIVVTASRVPLTFSDLTRDVIVIGPEEIKNLPVNSVQGLLQYALGVGLEQRGIDGVQSDVTIRGGNSEETLIMIDGVGINDPQTGHHNLNLPVPLQDVQRIEILEGPGSSIYGANAFSGVINRCFVLFFTSINSFWDVGMIKILTSIPAISINSFCRKVAKTLLSLFRFHPGNLLINSFLFKKVL